jgi:hypothetical protein
MSENKTASQVFDSRNKSIENSSNANNGSLLRSGFAFKPMVS